ncbi:MAG: histidine--tRNA ligase [Rhodospirillaceae bacterium]|nr:histidine--tRNA ligase [Rhodospirillaceae bacterium]MBT5374929.1 histidine--tRNA ligase [Rhodospirillaceae bacterium]MBT5660046.1 histidine--tRNA ligase [Rhodospirillaceae bacterium]MBT5752388.1 histidine--tRNA ligase [Rhodospirillaceae bacterium]
MSSLQPVRGTHDILSQESADRRHIVETGRNVALCYGYGEISTPIFEFTEVFKRTLGDTSDIVTKEMYTFEDRGGHEITLRPEGTAGIARAFISNGLAQNLPLRYFYQGPMFRYERPQKGRLRQFHQIGVELIGVPSPLADVETIALGAQVLRELGVLDRTVLEINTLGDTDSRNAYRAALVDYFSKHLDVLSEDSRTRLQRNPLRILDSKDKGDRALINEAPLFADYLNDVSRAFFDDVLKGLDALGLAYSHNPRLVRGLDYYCHTAFEFTTEALGAQGTVLAGGRYDGLISAMGGAVTPGIGWAAGIERLAMLVDTFPPLARAIAVIPVGDDMQETALKIAHKLRGEGFVIDMDYSGNLSKRLKRANKRHARAAILIGEEEVARDVATLRDLDTGEQNEIPLSALSKHLTPFR